MIPVAIGSLVVSCYGDLFTLWCRYSLMTWSWKPYNMLLSVDLWSSTRLLAWPTTQVKRKLCKGKSIAATPQSSYQWHSHDFTYFHMVAPCGKNLWCILVWHQLDLLCLMLSSFSTPQKSLKTWLHRVHTLHDQTPPHKWCGSRTMDHGW
jgi:hypothetical protein